MRMSRLGMVATALMVLAVGLVIASCGNANEDASSPSTTSALPPAGVQTTEDADLTVTTADDTVDAAALYSLVCAGCHPTLPRAPGGANQVRGVINMGKGYMPPFSGTLTVGEIVALADWVANGGE